MKKTKLLLLLALLMTAVTGAWAQDAKHLIKATYREQTRSLEQPLPYATTIGELYEAVTGEPFSDLISSMSALEMPLNGITSNNTSVASIGELNGASTPVTVKADGETTVSLKFGNYAQGIYLSATSPLYVTMKDGTKDADKWTVKVGEGQAQALPIGGLKEGDAVTLTYSGRLKVKGVKATSDAAPAEPVEPKFTINASGDQVKFAPGNLQATYNGSAWSWAFATNQWDIIGNEAANTSINGNGTISGTGTVDLFGWVGANSAFTGAAIYGITNSTTVIQYGNTADEALKSDWGNTIGDGWRTLTIDEWDYVLNTRTTTSGVSYAKATVNGIVGLILLPDNWSADYYSLASTNTAGAAYTTNEISSSDWTSKLEAHGAVFLPAGGYRTGATVTIASPNQGFYWSSTSSSNTTQARRLSFTNVGMNLSSGTVRTRGHSVRLVKAAE